MLSWFKKLNDLIKDDIGRLLISATVSFGGDNNSNSEFIDLPSSFLLYDMYAIFCYQALVVSADDHTLTAHSSWVS